MVEIKGRRGQSLTEVCGLQEQERTVLGSIDPGNEPVVVMRAVQSSERLLAFSLCVRADRGRPGGARAAS